VRPGDLLVTRAGPTYRVGICCFVHTVRPRLMLSDKIIRTTLPRDHVDGSFIALCLAAGPSRQYLATQQTGMDLAQMNISQARLRSVPLPLPPLAEQQRIMAKVEEMMGLCDRLDATTASQLNLCDRLAAGAVTAA
jgi:type I restriction enzyme S subunit